MQVPIRQRAVSPLSDIKSSNHITERYKLRTSSSFDRFGLVVGQRWDNSFQIFWKFKMNKQQKLATSQESMLCLMLYLQERILENQQHSPTNKSFFLSRILYLLPWYAWSWLSDAVHLSKGPAPQSASLMPTNTELDLQNCSGGAAPSELQIR